MLPLYIFAQRNSSEGKRFRGKRKTLVPILFEISIEPKFSIPKFPHNNRPLLFQRTFKRDWMGNPTSPIIGHEKGQIRLQQRNNSVAALTRKRRKGVFNSSEIVCVCVCVYRSGVWKNFRAGRLQPPFENG